MNIVKQAVELGSAAVQAEELEAINRFTKAQLKAEDVYTFSLILCDNDIDRDFERFDEKTLRELAELFVGKTGISDHKWESGRQVARIYRAEFWQDGSLCRLISTDPTLYLDPHFAPGARWNHPRPGGM